MAKLGDVISTNKDTFGKLLAFSFLLFFGAFGAFFGVTKTSLGGASNSVVCDAVVPSDQQFYMKACWRLASIVQTCLRRIPSTKTLLGAWL